MNNLSTTGELFVTNQVSPHRAYSLMLKWFTNRRYLLRDISLCIDVHVVATTYEIRHNILNNIHKSHGLAALISKTFINNFLANKDDMRNLNPIDKLVSYLVAITKLIVHVLEQSIDMVLVK